MFFKVGNIYDNIDIVINELDALVNIDLENRTIKKELTQLNIVRIGTSGSLQNDIPVDSFVMGKYGLGLDGLLHSYVGESIFETEIEDAFIAQTNWHENKARPYIIKGSETLAEKLRGKEVFEGFTATAPGFYGPQGRQLRLPIVDQDINDKIESFEFKNQRITNYEMESSAIFGLSAMLGHESVAVCAIIANRITKDASKDYHPTIKKLIQTVLDRLSK